MIEESLDVEKIVEAYLAIRTSREILLQKFEKEDGELKAEQSQLEVALLEVCNKVNANSIKTEPGTVIRKLTERYYCNDWDNFRKFVLDNKAVELLEKRIHQGNFKEFLGTHDGDGLPPGVNIMREFGVTVRRAPKQ
jgi:hypothetical protein